MCPTQAESICQLSPKLLELLRDADGEVVCMSLSVFMNVLQDKDILVTSRCSTTAPQLAETLMPLFENVRLCAPSHRHWMLLRNSVDFGPLPRWAWKSCC